jgi:multidrug resistance efflux pump
MSEPTNGAARERDGAATDGSPDGPARDGFPRDGAPSDGAPRAGGAAQESGSGVATATDDPRPTTPKAPPDDDAAPGKKRMKRSTRIGLLVVVVLALVAAGAFGARYFLDTRHYVSTDNAQIDGDKISVNAPANGYLINWTATEGTQMRAGQVVGRIKVIGGFVQPQQPIKAPADGTVAQDNGIEGTYVTAGTQLAIAYDISRVYVTARVDETDVDAVHPGQRVNISVDAYSGTDFTGVVREVRRGAAGEFSLFPQSNSTGNFQKVTQVIPVKISIDDLHGLRLVPGMNVTVDIRKDD